MSSSKPHRAVFFDLGGTLFSYRHVSKGTFPMLIEGSKRLGFEGEVPELAKAFGSASRRAYQRYADRAYYLHRDLFLDTYRELAREIGVEADDETVNWFYEQQRSALIEHLDLRADCLETLAALRERGLYLSIVSNIDDDHLEPLVERSGLAPLLDDWTSSEEAQSCKPDRAFFELALEKAACDAREVVFVGDSREHDVRGAREMGMTSVLIVEEGMEAPLQTGADTPEPHHEIRALSELLTLLR